MLEIGRHKSQPGPQALPFIGLQGVQASLIPHLLWQAKSSRLVKMSPITTALPVLWASSGWNR